jgi:hypothetical protein
VHSVALHGDGNARLGKNRNLGEVGKYHDECSRFGDVGLVGKLTPTHSDGIKFLGAIEPIDIEFSLIEAFKTTLYLKFLLAIATREQ